MRICADLSLLAFFSTLSLFKASPLSRLVTLTPLFYHHNLPPLYISLSIPFSLCLFISIVLKPRLAYSLITRLLTHFPFLDSEFSIYPLLSVLVFATHPCIFPRALVSSPFPQHFTPTRHWQSQASYYEAVNIQGILMREKRNEKVTQNHTK
jgi:hypothetical protein